LNALNVGQYRVVSHKYFYLLLNMSLRQSFREKIHPFVDGELAFALEMRMQGNVEGEFYHLERAHVLGQASTIEHVRVHMLMLAWGFRNYRAREVAGQAVRILGAALFTSVGLVPSGNTGGSNVGPFKPMPIPDDLKSILDQVSTKNSSR
jgi:hypothetical protein